MYASWLAIFRSHGYGITRVDARSLDVLAYDLPSHNMLADDTLHALRVHPIIQSGRTSRARDGRKPTTECRPRFCGEELSHQDVGSLRTSAEATLPGHLGVLLR